MERIWLSSPHMGGREKVYVEEAFQTNWVAPLGPNVDAFEKQLADYIQVESVAVLNSGTAALHLALEILGVKKDDIVLCQSFTFAASAFPIIYQHAVPVFIDSEAETWNMDPILLEQVIKDCIANHKKPAAIIVVHLYGVPAKMDEIMSIARQYQIPVIEDAAEALGSTYKGKHCGSIGDLGILSFNGNKIITTSGGGALCANDTDMVKKARFLSTQAREAAPYYLHKEIGYNYRMSNITAGIGRGQMEVLPQRVGRRREIFNIYLRELSNIVGLDFLSEPTGCLANRWLTTLVINPELTKGINNEKIRVHLETLNIESRPLWKPMHQQPVFSGFKAYNNGIADALFMKGLCLPSGSNMTDEQIGLVVSEIKKCLNEKK